MRFVTFVLFIIICQTFFWTVQKIGKRGHFLFSCYEMTEYPKLVSMSVRNIPHCSFIYTLRLGYYATIEGSHRRAPPAPYSAPRGQFPSRVTRPARALRTPASHRAAVL